MESFACTHRTLWQLEGGSAVKGRKVMDFRKKAPNFERIGELNGSKKEKFLEKWTRLKHKI